MSTTKCVHYMTTGSYRSFSNLIYLSDQLSTMYTLIQNQPTPFHIYKLIGWFSNITAVYPHSEVYMHILIIFKLL